jgi:hypothetical protein
VVWHRLSEAEKLWKVIGLVQDLVEDMVKYMVDGLVEDFLEDMTTSRKRNLQVEKVQLLK